MGRMAKVYRIDRASIGEVERLDNGMMRAPARLSRTGVFTYFNADGTVTRELRLPEEVFSPDSLRSFDLLPVIDEHPYAEPGAAVTAKNARKLSIGSVGHVRQDAADKSFVAAMLMIHDGDTVAKIDLGKREISLGYYADKEPAPPGATYQDPVTGDALPYDVIQRNIRGNHVALVKNGRAGPEARILLDDAAAIAVEWADRVSLTQSQTTGQRPDQKAPTMKLTIDGLEFEVEQNTHAAISKVLALNATALATAKAESDKARAQCDAAESTNKKLAAEVAELRDPKKLAEAVKARVSIETVAAQHGVKCDDLSDLEVRKAVVTKLDPSIKLDGKSEDYVIAMFDVLSTSKAASITKTITDAAKDGSTKPDVKLTNTDEKRRAFNDSFFKPVEVAPLK